MFLVLKWIHLLLFGSLYPSKGIDRVLENVFGDKVMAAPSYANVVGAKIGILAASIEQPMTYLFTNYNGIGGKRTGYVIPRESDKAKTRDM